METVIEFSSLGNDTLGFLRIDLVCLALILVLPRLYLTKYTPPASNSTNSMAITNPVGMIVGVMGWLGIGVIESCCNGCWLGIGVIESGCNGCWLGIGVIESCGNGCWFRLWLGIWVIESCCNGCWLGIGVIESCCNGEKNGFKIIDLNFSLGLDWIIKLGL